MDFDMKTLMEKTWVQYSLYVLLFALIYFGLVRRKVMEAFDMSAIDAKTKDAKSGASSATGSDDVVDVQDAETIGKDLKTNATKIEDGLHLDKYRTQTENIIIDMNEWIGAKTTQMLPAIAKAMASSDGSDISSVLQSIEKLNTLNNFKITLNGTMKYVDGK